MDFYLNGFFLCFVLNAVLVTAVFKFQTSFKEEGKLFECPSPGVFASPFSCQMFYTCADTVPGQDTLPEQYRCPKPLYFDDFKKSCVCKSKNLKCGPITDVMVATHVSYPDASPRCNRSMCKLPDCFCSEKGCEIPGNIHPNDAPQMIILTFTGPVNSFNGRSFYQLFDGSHSNPNGCPLKATFFTPHEYTSYYYVQGLYAEGHEIAMQGLSNDQSEDFWTEASTEQWAEEVIGMREALHTFSNVSRRDLVGMRAPSLQAGGNNMFKMLLDFGVDYDSSLEAPLSETPVWPYTLDYSMPHECLAKNCPRKFFPGIWEFPLNALGTNDITGSPCTYVEQCIYGNNKDDIFDFLTMSFDHYYSSNKAPLMLNFDSNWLLHSARMSALRSFIKYIVRNYKDIWFVTMRQALEWMRHPVPSQHIHKFGAWKCPDTTHSLCSYPNECF